VTTENTQAEFKLTESDFVILSFNKNWYWIFKDVKSTGLTQTELIEIESILKITVEENNERQKINLKRHNEEYPKNKWSETDSWKNDLMIVDDGGNCYFNLKVNLTNKTYSELMINGYA